MQYISPDMPGDSQWQNINSPLAGSHLQGQEIISLHIHKHTHKFYNFNIEK